MNSRFWQISIVVTLAYGIFPVQTQAAEPVTSEDASHSHRHGITVEPDRNLLKRENALLNPFQRDLLCQLGSQFSSSRPWASNLRAPFSINGIA